MDIRNHIWTAKKALELSEIDQENVRCKIVKLETINPNSSFFFWSYIKNKNASPPKSDKVCLKGNPLYQTLELCPNNTVGIVEQKTMVSREMLNTILQLIQTKELKPKTNF